MTLNSKSLFGTLSSSSSEHIYNLYLVETLRAPPRSAVSLTFRDMHLFFFYSSEEKLNLNLLLLCNTVTRCYGKKENSISENNSYDDDDGGNVVFLGESHPSVN